MLYRSDIDGLRAIAVLPVVLFHAGVPGFSGGYVGVDVFFVISGFLITGIIQREIDSGSFSLIRFYERRARRILPALFAVITFCIAAGALLLMPGPFMELGRSLVATTLFASNLFFWRTTDYFAPAAELVPLLHTWSLAVEEQFYIVFPLMMMALAGSLRRWRTAVVVALLVGSFALAAVMVHISPVATFFLPVTRAWELLIGSFVALAAGFVTFQKPVREAMGWLGITLIAVPVAVYDSATTFPGLTAVPPCLGAALILLSGQSHRTGAAAFLSARPLVFVGLVSYSFYLWHWPALAFLRVFRGEMHLPLALGLLAAAASLGAAYLSWRYVEQPFRQKGAITRPQIFAFSGAGMVAALVVGAAVLVGSGLPQRFPPEVIQFASGAADHDPQRASCLSRRPPKAPCPVGRQVGLTQFLLWGDSHADALRPAFSVAADAHGRRGVFFGKSSCAPLLNISRPGQTDCRDFNDAVLAWLDSDAGQSIETIFLSGRWAGYATGERAKGEAGGELVAIDYQSLDANQSPRSIFERGIRRTIEALQQRGKRVVVIGDVPEIGWDVPLVLSSSALWGREVPPPPKIEDVARRNREVHEAVSGVEFVGLASFLCRPDCMVEHDGKSIYLDDDHFSLYGATRVVGPRLAPLLWPDQRVEAR